MPPPPDPDISERPVAERRSFTIGLVNPDRNYREFVSRLLAAANHRVVEARDRNEVALVLASHRVDCLVLDYDLGGETGLEAFTRLKEAVDPMPATVMLTGAEDDRVAIAAFRIGLDDLVPKRGMQASDLIDAIASAVAKNVLADQQRAEIERNRRLATVDVATGLLSRREVERRLVALGASAARRNGSYAVLVATIDGIQRITNRFGMTSGDRALNMAASRLQKSIRPNDICGRYGDATFLYAVDADPSPEVIEDLRRRLHAALSFEYQADGSIEKLAPRIGIARFPEDASVPDNLVAAAVEDGHAVAAAAVLPATLPRRASVRVLPLPAVEIEAPANSVEADHREDRRRYQRTRVLKRANIALSEGRETVDCMVRDISEGGARLLLVEEQPIPQTFRLMIADFGQWRKVERRWEHWPDVGVEFVS